MAMDAVLIEQLIREGIPGAAVRIEDLRGDGDHYAAYVESPAFQGKTRVQAASDGLSCVRGPDGGRASCAGFANNGV